MGIDAARLTASSVKRGVPARFSYAPVIQYQAGATYVE